MVRKIGIHAVLLLFTETLTGWSGSDHTWLSKGGWSQSTGAEQDTWAGHLLKLVSYLKNF